MPINLLTSKTFGPSQVAPSNRTGVIFLGASLLFVHNRRKKGNWPLRYRCSALTNWANKPTGSWSLNWFVIYPGKMKMKLWIYETHIFEVRNEEISVKKILAVINATYAVAKRNQRGLRPLLFSNSSQWVLIRLTLTVRSVKTVKVLWDGVNGFSSLSEKTRKPNHLQMRKKDKTFFSVILRPWVLVRPVIEPRPNALKSHGTQPLRPTSRQFWRMLPL